MCNIKMTLLYNSYNKPEPFHLYISPIGTFQFKKRTFKPFCILRSDMFNTTLNVQCTYVFDILLRQQLHDR